MEAVEVKEPRPLNTGVRIEHFRSIVHAEIELGRVTLVVGANGSGKTNLLEAIAVAGASAAAKLDHEFLAARGIRPLVPGLVASRFEGEDLEEAILQVGDFSCALSGPAHLHTVMLQGRLQKAFAAVRARWEAGLPVDQADLRGVTESTEDIEAFLIYTPEYTALRTFTDEGQILPLGVRGEGLFKHLVDLSRTAPDVVTRIGEHLRVLDWFDGFVIPTDLGPGEKRLAIRDRYLAADVLLDSGPPTRASSSCSSSTRCSSRRTRRGSSRSTMPTRRSTRSSARA